MKINTRYSIGETAYYFNTDALKVVQVKITGISIEVPELGDPKIFYGINLNKVCAVECSVVDDVTAFLMSKCDDDLITLTVPEGLLFGSFKEFVDYIDPHQSLFEDGLWGSPIKVSTHIAEDLEDSEVKEITKDGNT